MNARSARVPSSNASRGHTPWPARALKTGELLFRWRSWTPVPLALWIVAHARPKRRCIILGSVILIAGLALRLWAAAHIGPKSRTRGKDGPIRKATGGPYLFLDHPLYLGNALLSGGLVLMSGAGRPWLPVMFPSLWFAQYCPIMLWEEARVRCRFGKTSAPAADAVRADWILAWRSERRTRQSVLLFLCLTALSVFLKGRRR